MRRWSQRTLLVLGCLAGVSTVTCSRLPDAAAPKLTGIVDSALVDSSDVTPYRQLSRDDFRARKPPPEFSSISGQLGAATCTQLSTSPQTRILVTERRERDSVEYSSRVTGLSFRAVMDRKCSWWNDELAAFSPTYVLMHEQIHFALTELVARRMNAAAERSMNEMQFRGSTQDEVLERAHQAIRDHLRQGSEEMVEENRDFDEDTSMGYRPERQRQWLDRVNAELHRTRAWGGEVTP